MAPTAAVVARSIGQTVHGSLELSGLYAPAPHGSQPLMVSVVPGVQTHSSLPLVVGISTKPASQRQSLELVDASCSVCE